MIVTKESIKALDSEFKEFCIDSSCIDCPYQSHGREGKCFIQFLCKKIDENMLESSENQDDTEDNILFQPVQNWEFNCGLEEIIGLPIRILDPNCEEDGDFYVPYLYGIIQDFGTEYMTIQFDSHVEKYHVTELMKLKPTVLDLEADIGETR